MPYYERTSGAASTRQARRGGILRGRAPDVPRNAAEGVMPISTQYFPTWNLWVEKASGHLTLAQAQAMKHKEIGSGQVDEHTVVLVDLRETTIDPEEARQWSPWLKTTYPDYRARAAYLVEEPRVTGLMLLIKNAFSKRQTEVFSSLPEALHWLGLDPSECTPRVLGLER